MQSNFDTCHTLNVPAINCNVDSVVVIFARLECLSLVAKVFKKFIFIDLGERVGLGSEWMTLECR